MERLPKFEWQKLKDYNVSYDPFYNVSCSGVDKENKPYSFGAYIQKVNIYKKCGAIKSGYTARYSCTLTDKQGSPIVFNNTQEPFETLAEAKKWVTAECTKHWQTMHQ